MRVNIVYFIIITRTVTKHAMHGFLFHMHLGTRPVPLVSRPNQTHKTHEIHNIVFIFMQTNLIFLRVNLFLPIPCLPMAHAEEKMVARET